MTERRFQDIWMEQCEAARRVREQHGVVAALDYLIGEKLMTFAETAASRPEFAAQLPRFVAEIRSLFKAEEIGLYVDHLELILVKNDAELSTDTADDDEDAMIETPEQRTAERERFSRLKDLLTLTVLGTA